MNSRAKIILTTLLLTLVPAVSANSTMRYYENSPVSTLDYFWVPGNVLLFHLDYPWDFVLYIFAAYGAYRLVRFMILDFPVLLVDWLRSE